jgi:hypothetical protein
VVQELTLGANFRGVVNFGLEQIMNALLSLRLCNGSDAGLVEAGSDSLTAE